MIMRIIASVAALVLLSSPSSWAEELPPAVGTKKEMIVTANPLATAAGAEILKQGGTAADAMVAAQVVLSLVEPQASGVGGGAFIVYYDAETGETTTIDAREKAPAAAMGDRFSGLSFFQAWQSGLSVGVPGVPRMMEYMLEKYGNKKFKKRGRNEVKKLYQFAIDLSENGYAITGRTADQINRLLALNTGPDKCAPDRLFLRDPAAFEYFVDAATCTAKPEGTIVTNQAYADVLKKLAKEGDDAFYTGEIAQNIVDAVQNDLNLPDPNFTLQDMASYNIVERPPVCFDYRTRSICGMGPPSSGALAVGQMLGILEALDNTGNEFGMTNGGPLNEKNVHLFSQAGRLAFADRGLYVADPDFVTVPVAGMLNKAYLASRAALITGMDMGSASPGVPPGPFLPFAAYNRTKNTGTSHVSIIDRYGNALSMTTTVESLFGNGVMVNGFLLNNQLTDFSFSATSGGIPIANRVEGNKRPRSSMSPSIVFDADGKVEIVTGSPGGSRIIGYTAQSILNMIDFELDPQEAIYVPHYGNRNTTATEVEEPIPGETLDFDVDALKAALRVRGHTVSENPSELTSGLSIIQVLKKRPGKRLGNDDDDAASRNKRLKAVFLGGGDLRRDGTVGGR